MNPRWTIEGPDSSYSCFEIHICWKVESELQTRKKREDKCLDCDQGREWGRKKRTQGWNLRSRLRNRSTPQESTSNNADKKAGEQNVSKPGEKFEREVRGGEAHRSTSSQGERQS